MVDTQILKKIKKVNLQETDENTLINLIFCYNLLEQKRALSLDKDTS